MNTKNGVEKSSSTPFSIDPKIAVLPVTPIEQTMRSTAFDSAVKKCYYTIVINARKGFRNDIFSYIVCIINFGY